MPIVIRVVRQKQKGLGLRSLRTESLYILHIINCIHFFIIMLNILRMDWL